MRIEYYSVTINNVKVGRRECADGFDGARMLNILLDNDYAAVTLPCFGDRNRFEIRADSPEQLAEYLAKIVREQSA